jgi:hypothetical protein
VGGSDAVYINSSGNLGLGVTPAFRFHVYSSVNNETRFQTASTTAGHTNRLSFSVPTGTADARSGVIEWYDLNTFKGDMRFLKAGGIQIRNSADSPTLALDDSGNLLVGPGAAVYTAAGRGNVTSSGSSEAVFGLSINNTPSGYLLGTTTNVEIGAPAGRFISFNINGEKARIDANGNLLLKTNGTASAPTIANADNPDTGLYWPTDADTLALATAGSDRIYLSSTGPVGIGVTPSGWGGGAIVNLPNAGAISSTGITTSIVANGYYSDQWRFYGNGRYCQYYQNDGAHVFFSSDNNTGGANQPLTPLERLRIKSTGQLNFTGLASAPTGAVGDLYYNSTSNTLQYHNNSAFQQISRKYTVALNDGSVTVVGNAYTLTHNMGSRDITVSVRRTTDNVVVLTDVSMPSTTTATITFAAAITAADYTVTVIG